MSIRSSQIRAQINFSECGHPCLRNWEPRLNKKWKGNSQVSGTSALSVFSDPLWCKTWALATCSATAAVNLASAVPPSPWVLSDREGKISLPGTLSHSRKSNQPSVSLENLHPFQQTKDTLFYFVLHINKILIQEIPSCMYGGNADVLLDTTTIHVRH